jgi:hypothetical protein
LDYGDLIRSVDGFHVGCTGQMNTPLNIARKAFLLSAFMLLISSSTRAQDANPSKEKFLNNEALRASLEAMNREFGKLDLTYRGSRAPIDFQNMVVRKDPAITDGLSSQFGECRVTYLDDTSLVGQWKGLKKQFAILFVRPLDRPDGRLRITVHLVWISYRRAQLQFGIDSWANVYFRFDPANQTYVVADVELAGV